MIALERLQETFFLGEYSTELNLIPTAQRRDMLDIYRALVEAAELAEAKDYEGVAELAASINALAEDFPIKRVLSSVETAKSMSDMAVFAAVQYRNLGDFDKARTELRRAIEIWPSNPSVREFQTETTKLATAGTQGVKVFDDLYERKDYRGIYEHRMDLGFALAEDPIRKPLLMEVIKQVSGIELLVAQSNEMLKQGDPYQAWEALAMAARINADDAGLNKARARSGTTSCRLCLASRSGGSPRRVQSAGRRIGRVSRRAESLPGQQHLPRRYRARVRADDGAAEQQNHDEFPQTGTRSQRVKLSFILNPCAKSSVLFLWHHSVPEMLLWFTPRREVVMMVDDAIQRDVL